MDTNSMARSMITRGQVYRLKSGLIVCVSSKNSQGDYVCIVLKGNDYYNVGGYDVVVPERDLLRDNMINFDLSQKEKIDKISAQAFKRVREKSNSELTSDEVNLVSLFIDILKDNIL